MTAIKLTVFSAELDEEMEGLMGTTQKDREEVQNPGIYLLNYDRFTKLMEHGVQAHYVYAVNDLRN